MSVRIILASGSPRRRRLMALAGIECEIIESGADEMIEGAPSYQAEALAIRKARTVRPLVTGEAVIVAADTLVAIDGRVLGKPADAAEAFAMLKTLQGRRHTVYTGVALIRVGDGGETLNSFVDSADVIFHKLSDAEINAYIATGEPFDKAGGYGVQDCEGALVERVEGEYTTVVGLPMPRLLQALKTLSELSDASSISSTFRGV